MEELKEIERIAKESLEVQKKVLELTEGMHKLLREIRRIAVDKLGNL